MKETLLKLIFIFFLSLNSICTNAQSLPVLSISDEAEIEGTDLVHTVTLSSISTVDEMYNFGMSLNFNTVDSGDWDIITINDVFFTSPTSDIVIVPAGVSSFTISTITIDDTIEENVEFYTIAFGSVSATGTIIDNDTNTTTISSVSDAAETEGVDLIHEISLSNLISGTKNFPIDVIDISTDTLDYDDILFSDGITYDFSTEIITFPEIPDGINNFTITIPTIDDLLIEDDESYSLTVGTRSGTGTILDNDTITITSVSDASGIEGTDLVHTIRLSNINPTIKYYSYALIDNTTSTTDYSSQMFSDGVTLNTSTNIITVPIGISSFTISIPTIDDLLDENDEFYDLHIEDFSVKGTIIDNDTYFFPKYFTPNDDSFHDTWPYDLSENSYIYNNSVIYIFDRYGKLLKEISSSSNGWDGTFNGKKMPVNDYWFQIVLQDGEVHIGHFTLKR